MFEEHGFEREAHIAREAIMCTYFLSIAVVVNGVVEVIADDENKSADHKCVEDFIDVVLRPRIGILFTGVGFQSHELEGGSQIWDRLDEDQNYLHSEANSAELVLIGEGLIQPVALQIVSPADEHETENGSEADEDLGHFSRVVYSLVPQWVEIDLVLGFIDNSLHQW